MTWSSDLFDLFRTGLVIVCSIYAVLQIASTMWGWHEYLTPHDRRKALLRRYVFVQLLRLRVRGFAFDLLQILILVAALIYLIHLHDVLGIW